MDFLYLSFHQLSQPITNQPFLKPALSITTILYFLAILMASMQATLIIESNHTTPISLQKLIYLLVFEFIEIAVIIAAEVISFIQLQNVLQSTVQCLHWIPPCFVLIAFVKLYLDVIFTFTSGHHSYRNALPFRTQHYKPHAVLILISTSMTAIPSIILFGWTQQYWWKLSSFNNSSQLLQSIQTHPYLSNSLFIYSIVWSLCILIPVAIIIAIFVYNKLVVPNVLHTWILLVVHLSALPMLILVTAAVAQLHDTLDLHTYNVLKEFSNAVIIIAFMDIAIVLKTLCWNTTTNTRTDLQSQVVVPGIENV